MQKSYLFTLIQTSSIMMVWVTKEGSQQEKSLDNHAKIAYNIIITNNGDASEKA